MADPSAPLTLDDLAEMELLLPLPGTAFRDELDAVTRPLGITLLPAAEIDGLRLIASLTFEGYGPAILPATAIPRFLRRRFRPVPIEGLPRRRVGVAQRSRGLPSAPTRALNELLRRGGGRARRPTPTGVHVEAVTTAASAPPPDAGSGACGLGTRGSRHMRQMGGPPAFEWNSSMTSKPKRA